MTLKSPRESILSRLALLSLVLVVYPALTFGVLGYALYRRALEDRFAVYVDSQIDMIAEQAAGKVEETGRALLQVLYGQDLRDWALRGQAVFAADDPAGIGSFRREFENYLVFLSGTLPYCRSAAVVLRRPEGPVAFASHDFVRDSQSRYWYGQEAESIIALGAAASFERRPGLGAFAHRSWLRTGGMYYGSRVVEIGSSFRDLGTVMLELDLDPLFEPFLALLGDPLSSVYVFDDEGGFLWTRSPEEGWHQAAADLAASVSGTAVPRGPGALVARTVPGLGWTVVARVSPASLLASMRSVGLGLVVFGLLSLPLFVLLVLAFHRNLTAPLASLVGAMRDVEAGKLGTRLGLKRADELGYVIESFDRMSAEIKRLVDEVYREELALKDAELRSLQARMDPHFLFNTLESMNWRAVLSGDHELSDMIRALARVASAGFARDGRRFISLAEEMESVEAFVLIMRMRFGERLDVELDVPKVHAACLVPRFSVQPLVENALLHGLEPAGGGRARLSARKRASELVIKVEDDGAGLAAGKLEALRAVLADDAAPVGPGGPATLASIHRRARMAEGRGLTLEAREGGGTRCVLALPYRKEGGD